MGNQHSSQPRQRPLTATAESIGEPWTYPRVGQQQHRPAWPGHGPVNQAAYEQFERECVQFQQAKSTEQQLRFARYGPGEASVQQAKKIKVLPTTVNGTPLLVNGGGGATSSAAAVVKLRPTENGLALQKVGTLANRKQNAELELKVQQQEEEETRSPTPDYDRRRSRSKSRSAKTKAPTAPSTPKSSVKSAGGSGRSGGGGGGKLRLFKTKSDATKPDDRVRARSLEYLRADVRDETQERRHSSRDDVSGDDDSPLAMARSGPITVFSSQKKLNAGDDDDHAGDADDDWEEMPRPKHFYFGSTPGDVAVTKAPAAKKATPDSIDLDEESRRVMEEFDAVLAVESVKSTNGDKCDADADADADDEDQDIALNLRPILPKKPQQLPRFSPSAAWRALGSANVQPDYYHRPAANKLNASSSKASDMSAMDLSEEDEDDDVLEDRINKNGLRPVAPHAPRISNEKSADSGISGDAGSPDAGAKPLAMSSPVPHQNWTPQQDLLDDDSSTEEAGQPERDEAAPPKIIIPKSQMFNNNNDCSTTLDAGSRSSSVSKGRKYRKRHETGDDHAPQKYNSLRKLKRSVSGAFASAFRRSKSTSEDDDQDDDDDQVDDNWVLSRSAPNSIVNGSVDGDGGASRAKFKSEADLLSGLAPPTLGQQYPAYSQPSVFNQRIVYLPQYDSRKAHGERRRLDEQSEMMRRAKSADAVFHQVKQQPLSATQRLFGIGQHRKFTFQSTVRLQEKRLLEEKLSREAETRERKRIQEVQAMQRVEEEFQKKRAREKANIRQQLRVLQLVDSTRDRSARMDPEGAPSSLSSSHRRTSSDEMQKQQQQHYKAVVINQSRMRSAAAPPSPATAAAALEARVNAERATQSNGSNVHKKSSTSNIYKRLAEIASEEESIAPPPPVPVLVSSARKPQRPPSASTNNSNNNNNNNSSNSSNNSKVMTQELSEYRQERREYRDVRSPRNYQQQVAPAGRYYTPSSSGGQRHLPVSNGVPHVANGSLANGSAKVQSDNYRWDFAHGGRHHPQQHPHHHHQQQHQQHHQNGKMLQASWHHHQQQQHHPSNVMVRHHDYQPAYYKMTSPGDVIVMHRTPHHHQRHYY